MHGYSRLGRSKGSGGVGGGGSSSFTSSSWSKFVFVVMSAILRRRGLLLFAPLLYISGMLLYMGSLSFDVVLVHKHRHRPPPPGSLYTSPQLFHNLWPFMETDNSTSLNVVSSFHLYSTCISLPHIANFLHFLQCIFSAVSCILLKVTVCSYSHML